MADRRDVPHHGGRGTGILADAQSGFVGRFRGDRHDVRAGPQLLFPRLPGRALSDPNPCTCSWIRLFVEPALRVLQLILHRCHVRQLQGSPVRWASSLEAWSWSPFRSGSWDPRRVAVRLKRWRIDTLLTQLDPWVAIIVPSPQPDATPLRRKKHRSI